MVWSGGSDWCGAASREGPRVRDEFPRRVQRDEVREEGPVYEMNYGLRKRVRGVRGLVGRGHPVCEVKSARPMSDLRIESGTVESNRRRDGRSPRVRDENETRGASQPGRKSLTPR